VHLAHGADQAIERDPRPLGRHQATSARARDSTVHALGWMQTDAYLALARRSMRHKVIEPLLARGIEVKGTEDAPAASG
jgi:hypothetical protein